MMTSHSVKAYLEFYCLLKAIALSNVVQLESHFQVFQAQYYRSILEAWLHSFS